MAVSRVDSTKALARSMLRVWTPALPVQLWRVAMTVDMLTATFLWPESVVLGAEDDVPEAAERSRGDADRVDELADFWTAVKRLFRAASWGGESAVQG
jgi:hypothetical protein